MIIGSVDALYISRPIDSGVESDGVVACEERILNFIGFGVSFSGV
jgi:hypothetical protein